MSEYEKQFEEIGELVYTPLLLEHLGFEFRQASSHANQKEGCDFWVREDGIMVGVDVKNTDKVYVFRYDVREDIGVGRHPFKLDSKAKYILHLNLDPEMDPKDYVFEEPIYKGMFTIKERLGKFFNSTKKMEEFLELNQKLFGTSLQKLYPYEKNPAWSDDFKRLCRHKYLLSAYVKEGFEVFFDPGIRAASDGSLCKYDGTPINEFSLWIQKKSFETRRKIVVPDSSAFRIAADKLAELKKISK